MTFIGHSAPGLSVVTMLLVMMLFVCTVDGQSAGQSFLYQIDCEISSTKTVEWSPNVKKMGFFDVQGAVDDDGEKGHWWMSLGSRSSAKPRTVITSIFISTSNTATSRCPTGFIRRCWWDVDSAIATNGQRGHYATGLCIRYEPFRIGMVAVNDVVLRASSTAAIPATPKGYIRRGAWDVSGDSYSYFDNSKGHYMMGIYARGARVGTPPAPVRQPMVYQVDCEISSTKTVEWDPMNYNGKKLGFFDVQGAVDDDGEKGHWWMSLGSKSSIAPKTVITDVQIRAGNTATTNCPSGYIRRCWWDVDSGVGTDGKSGHYAIALCLRSAPYRAGVIGVTDVILRTGSSKVVPSTPSGYLRRGYWDVSGDSYSYYDKSRGHWMMGIYTRSARIAPLPTPAPTPSPTDLPTPAPTPSPTDLPTPAPTPSPTNLPTPAPTPSPTDLPTAPSCKAQRVWSEKTAVENCGTKKNKTKQYGVKSCKKSHQMRLERSLANMLYFNCKAKCVYDYSQLVAGKPGAFSYVKKQKCYKPVSRGGCFKKKKEKHYKQAQEKAKMLCTE